jgi:hypothetical protein
MENLLSLQLVNGMIAKVRDRKSLLILILLLVLISLPFVMLKLVVQILVMTEELVETKNANGILFNKVNIYEILLKLAIKDLVVKIVHKLLEDFYHHIEKNMNIKEFFLQRYIVLYRVILKYFL